MLDHKDFDDLKFVPMLDIEQHQSLVHLQDFCHFQDHSKGEKRRNKPIEIMI